MLCNLNCKIRDALVAIEKNGKGVVFIVDDNNKLLGILTDGDIRRLLLEGFGLNDDIMNHMNKSFLYANINDDKSAIFEKFNNRISIIPLVDDNGKYVDYVEFKSNQKISLAQPQLIGNEYKYLNDALLSSWISSTGKYIGLFEETFSKWCGAKYGVATSNGTTALHLALVALGIGKGDEVIVPDLTFAATINSVIYTGATPVIVDIEKDSWCIDPIEIENHITNNTKAIIPVHLYGQPCDMEKIVNIAKKHNLYVIEDCAEAHGAEFKGQKVGTFGEIGCFSFFANKVITTGEGGMCITNSNELYEKMRVLRDHGMSKNRRYYHETIGFNYRMTNMQAAIGTAQVERIDEILKWRNSVEEYYRKELSNCKNIELQLNNIQYRKKIAWLVSILVKNSKKDLVIKKLLDNGIDVRSFFIPLSKMDIYKNFAVAEYKNSHSIAEEGINLPTTYEITPTVVKRIVEVINNV